MQARVFWNRPACRLKLVMPGIGTRAEYEVPGGTIHRKALKEVPGGRWVKCTGRRRAVGFASDALYNYDLAGDTLRATVVRSSRYAADLPETEESPRHLPVIDRGEYRFKFLLTHSVESLPRLARELEAAPVTLPIAPRQGTIPPRGSFAQLENDHLQMLALKPAEDGNGWIVRFQEMSHQDSVPEFYWLGKPLKMDRIPPSSIATYRVVKKGKAWSSSKVGLNESPI